MIGERATATTKTPPRTAATQTAPPRAAQPAAPRQGQRTFADARPRGSSGLFLKGQPDGTAGKYTLRVNRVTQKWANPHAVNDMFPQPTAEELATTKPAFKKQDAYNIEVEVTESNVVQCPPGYVATITFTDRYPESYMDDVKGFLCACFNADPAAVDLGDWQNSYQGDQPAAGLLIDAMVLERPTQKGGIFTKHIFNACKEQYPDAA